MILFIYALVVHTHPRMRCLAASRQIQVMPRPVMCQPGIYRAVESASGIGCSTVGNSHTVGNPLDRAVSFSGCLAFYQAIYSRESTGWGSSPLDDGDYGKHCLGRLHDS